MTDIIAVAQRKGGVGKTTLSVSLAAELARRGRGVALVDSDPQRSACQWAEVGALAFPVHEITLADQSVSDWVRHVRTVPGECVVIDTAPNDRALGAAIALATLVLVPCTPSGLDLEASVRTLEIIDAVRARREGVLTIILVPNRVDARTLEGQQIREELEGFGEVVAPAIGDRLAFVRAFTAGASVADLAPDSEADHEIAALCDLAEAALADVRRRSKPA
ncbi:MAG TPA: ParA family protein [Xanthobacteraceae bacterium]|nr:ParA family protein [Xanthobacteraceae bacterium]